MVLQDLVPFHFPLPDFLYLSDHDLLKFVACIIKLFLKMHSEYEGNSISNMQ